MIAGRVSGVKKEARKRRFGMAHHRRMSVFGLAFFMSALLSMTCDANAYVLEGPYIIELMSGVLGGAQTLRVRQDVIVDDASVARTSVTLTETLSYIYPNRYRSDAWFQNTNRVVVVSHDQSLTIIDGKIAANKQSRFDYYKNPLLCRTRFSLTRALLATGVDVGVSSLGRMEKTIVFVIGAQYPDLSVSQLWVDKESYLPLRWLVFLHENNDADKKKSMDFFYRNWQKKDKHWYPMLIESYSNGRLIRKIHARDVIVNADFSPELLNIAYLKKIYLPSDSQAPQQQPSSDMDDVEKTIDEFKKKFEP